ncbi:MAG: hypothetical protein KF823_10150 [Xanthomonadales bacterium]|nr:hypothetical protein [Xanthomonadales bacterium]
MVAAEVTQAPSAAPAAAAPGTLDAAGEVAGRLRELAPAWLELFRAEAALAKASAQRLVIGTVLAVPLLVMVWLFGCLALGYWLSGLLARTDLAMALVAGFNALLVLGLALAIRRWARDTRMTGSRAALGELAKALS